MSFFNYTKIQIKLFYQDFLLVIKHLYKFFMMYSNVFNLLIYLLYLYLNPFFYEK